MVHMTINQFSKGSLFFLHRTVIFPHVCLVFLLFQRSDVESSMWKVNLSPKSAACLQNRVLSPLSFVFTLGLIGLFFISESPLVCQNLLILWTFHFEVFSPVHPFSLQLSYLKLNKSCGEKSTADRLNANIVTYLYRNANTGNCNQNKERNFGENTRNMTTKHGKGNLQNSKK